MTVARINGANLWFEVIGNGEPILMMHGGLGMDHTYLRPWHDALADQARLIYFDHRWNGRSERVGPADHAQWHADAAALLDHLQATPATIYGHSYGAWLALGFAVRYPELVSRLILCGASPAFDYQPDLSTQQEQKPAAVQALVASFEQPPSTDDEMAELLRAIFPLYFAGPTRMSLLDGMKPSAEGYALGGKALAAFSVVDQLAAMALPIQVLVGRHDFITPVSQAHRIASLARRVEVVELPNSGHFPFAEEPDAYLAAFRAALRP